MLHHLARLLTRLNPTNRGHDRLIQLLLRWRALPPAGVYDVAPGVRMRLKMDNYFDAAIYFRAYERVLSKLLFRAIQPGCTFVDVGANMGYYSLHAAVQAGPQGRILSFEPNPIIFRLLQENAEITGLRNIELHPLGLSEQDGQADLHIPLDTDLHGHASLNNQGWDEHPATPVQLRRLDDFAKALGRGIDVVKVDAEGAELSILRGAESTIAEFQPTLFVELNPETAESFGYDPLEIPRFLNGLHKDYEFTLVRGHGRRSVSLRQMEAEQLRTGDLMAAPPLHAAQRAA